MINRIRTLVFTATATAALAAGFGAAAFGGAGTANADVCWDLPIDGTTSYYYC